MRQPNRIEPKLPAATMKTYQIAAPKSTHRRKASCAEYDCPAHIHGWATKVDESTDLGKAQAWYIRNQSGRRFVEDRDSEPCITVFAFEAGQTCFREHTVPIGKPELFIVRGGDWRGNPTGEHRQHTSPADWVDDFANHQDRVARQIERG